MRTTSQIALPSESSDPRVEVSLWEDGEIRVECTSDWCGDTESGFGASVGVTLSAEQAKELAKFLQKILEG